MPTAALGISMDSACSFPVHTEPAMAAGTPALAIPVMSCRRVIATSVLFLRAGLSPQLLGMRDVGRDSRHARFGAALKALRRDPCRTAYGSGNRTNQRCCTDLQSSSRAVNRRISFGRSSKMDGDGFERSHFPNDVFFCATEAGDADPDRPNTWDLVEVARSTRGVGHWTLATEFVEAPAFAMAVVAEGRGEASGIEVRAARAVLVDHSVIAELRTVEFIHLRQATHRHVFQNHREQVVWIGRASGEIDNRLAGNHRVDTNGACGIWISGRHPAP